jgi:flagellar L-ring protein precursor FlgH
MRLQWMSVIAIALVCASLADARADSLFAKGVDDRGTLISETTQRFEVGDLITVMVRENTQATTKADTDTKKESDVDSSAPPEDNPFLTKGLGVGDNRLPNWLIGMKNEQKTEGATRRSNQLVMTVTCSVTDVLPNGIVVIEGKKSVKINREESSMKIHGRVRARDVQPDNTIDSNFVADAEVELVGNGPLWRNQKRGFITRILDWFSPY